MALTCSFLYYQEKIPYEIAHNVITTGHCILSIAPQIHADTHSRDKTTVKEVRQKATETTDAIKNYTVEKRDEAARKVEVRFNSLDTRIKALDARIDNNWEKMDNVARERARNTLTVLREKRIRVAVMVREYEKQFYRSMGACEEWILGCLQFSPEFLGKGREGILNKIYITHLYFLKCFSHPCQNLGMTDSH